MENDRPIVSIIMSNFNHSKYVGRSIECVLNQTFKDFELIVVDDCSTDNSREVISQFDDPRVRKFFLEENQGMCTVFNYALSQARGKYFARLDSDDFWFPEKLQKQYDYMEQHPEVGACFTWVRVVDENEKVVPSELCENRDKVYNSHNRTQAEWLHQFYFNGCCVCHPTAFIRREVIEKVGIYNYTLKQTQDLDMWIRIAKHYQLHVICEPLINYRWFLHDTANASASSNAVAIRGMYEFFRILSTFHNELSDELFKEAFKDEMYNKDASTHDELACERALIMLHKSYLGYSSRIIGLEMIADLFQNDSTRKILKEKYNITTKTYAEWTNYPVFYDSPRLEDENSKKVNVKEEMKKRLRKYPNAYRICKKIYNSIKNK